MKDLRSIPPLMREGVSWEGRREEIRELLTDVMYGRIPGGRAVYTWERRDYPRGMEGLESGSCEEVTVKVTGVGGEHVFPFYLWLPELKETSCPAVVYISLEDPREEFPKPDSGRYPQRLLLHNGVALAELFIPLIERDDAVTFPEGLARTLCGARTEHSAGALAVWAEAMRIAVDILSVTDGVDASRICVAGCSRCGKTALWCGAQDERVYLTASFDSGCGGAALESGKLAERKPQMMKNFPHWMCQEINRYADCPEKLPFDQHYLLALVAPRKLLVTSATKDPFSDSYSEFLSLAYAQPAYAYYGKDGIGTFIQPPAEQVLIGDQAAYYLRDGGHGVEEGDWQALLALLRA